MTLAKVDFDDICDMVREKERQEYSAAWLYIHSKGKAKQN